MKLHLKEFEITDLTGQSVKFDIAKDFANYLYISTGDLGMLEVAQAVYKSGELEITEANRAGLTSAIGSDRFPFVAVVKRELLKLLEDA